MHSVNLQNHLNEEDVSVNLPFNIFRQGAKQHMSRDRRISYLANLAEENKENANVGAGIPIGGFCSAISRSGTTQICVASDNEVHIVTHQSNGAYFPPLIYFGEQFRPWRLS